MANYNRGEQDLTFEDHTYTLVLLNDDLAALEGNLNMGAEELFSSFRTQTARITHVNAILAKAFSRATSPLTGHRMVRKDIEALVPRIPYSVRRITASMLVAGALNYLNEQNPDPEEPEEEGNGAVKESTDPLSETGASTGHD